MLQGANLTGKAVAKTKLANIKRKNARASLANINVVSTGHHVEARLVLCPATICITFVYLRQDAREFATGSVRVQVKISLLEKWRKNTFEIRCDLDASSTKCLHVEDFEEERRAL